MNVAVEIPHSKHDSVTFVDSRLEVRSTAWTSENGIEILTVELPNYTVTSVYQSPKIPFSFCEPANFDSKPIHIVLGDFTA